jgi:hypothetical protein
MGISVLSEMSKVSPSRKRLSRGIPWAFSASGGNTTGTYTADGINYKYHVFTSSGDFTVTVGSAPVDVLIVGGGGGGGVSLAGGGGGGGVAVATGRTVGVGTYSIVVGSGGAGGTSTASPGGLGGNSSAFGQTVTGGQGGRSRYQNAASWPAGANGGGGANDASNTSPGTGVKPTEVSPFFL